MKLSQDWFSVLMHLPSHIFQKNKQIIHDKQQLLTTSLFPAAATRETHESKPQNKKHTG